MRRKNLFGFFERKEAAGGPETGDSVKVRFTRGGETERIWVKVTGKSGKKYKGVLDNEPVVINKSLGDSVTFSRSQIVEGPGANPRTNPEELCDENDKLKQKVESLEETLHEIADVAAASRDGSEDEDELKEKLNTVLDLAEPDSTTTTEGEDELGEE